MPAMCPTIVLTRRKGTTMAILGRTTNALRTALRHDTTALLDNAAAKPYRVEGVDEILVGAEGVSDDFMSTSMSVVSHALQTNPVHSSKIFRGHTITYNKELLIGSPSRKPVNRSEYRNAP